MIPQDVIREFDHNRAVYQVYSEQGTHARYGWSVAKILQGLATKSMPPEGLNGYDHTSFTSDRKDYRKYPSMWHDDPPQDEEQEQIETALTILGLPEALAYTELDALQRDAKLSTGMDSSNRLAVLQTLETKLEGTKVWRHRHHIYHHLERLLSTVLPDPSEMSAQEQEAFRTFERLLTRTETGVWYTRYERVGDRGKDEDEHALFGAVLTLSRLLQARLSSMAEEEKVEGKFDRSLIYDTINVDQTSAEPYQTRFARYEEQASASHTETLKTDVRTAKSGESHKNTQSGSRDTSQMNKWLLKLGIKGRRKGDEMRSP